ncbi:site-specific DNA-methyltransferase [Agrobacterium rubi]|nr:site-specific DNA-methyltransferase [Agrobacterium rubi]NTF24481.1 site-specific DNA-methyltransferase [Agrobacterium rubi]
MALQGTCQIIVGDALETVRGLSAESVDLFLTSPPYNIGKEYETRVSLDEYVENQRSVIEEAARTLVHGGSLCWQVGNYVHDGEVIPLDAVLLPVIRQSGLKIRNRIVWSYGHGQHCRRRLSGRYETVLWATRGDGYHFDLDAIRIPQLHPRKKAYKGARKGLLSGNPLGKNPGDVWHIPNINFNHPEKTAHPCQFPEMLAERLISALSRPGDMVVDPYAGSGTTGAVASRLGRRSLLVEMDAGYAAIAAARIGKS